MFDEGLRTASCLMAACLVAGCPTRETQRTEPTLETPVRARATTAVSTAGATCRGRQDCAHDHNCVHEVCRHQRTNVRAEILIEAARGLLTAGDTRSAVEAFDEGFDAYDASDAPIPPEALCDGAIAALQVREGDQVREHAARLADRCLRESLPGDARRVQVLAGLARLRHDGIDLNLFDAPDPPDQYYTLEPTVPGADSVAVQLRFADGDEAGYAQTRELLGTEAANRVIADCFAQEWSQSHARSLDAALLLDMSTRLRDVGDTRLYVGRVRVLPSAADSFSECTAGALNSLLAQSIRLSRSAIWQQPLQIHARLH